VCNIDSCKEGENAVDRNLESVCRRLRLPQTEVVCEVDEGSDGGAGSEEHNLEGHLLRVGQGAVLDAVCALVVIPRNTWLRSVHAKGELVEDAKVTSSRSRADTGLGIVDQEGVLLGQERRLATGSVLGVPEHLGIAGRVVHGNGVCCLVCSA